VCACVRLCVIVSVLSKDGSSGESAGDRESVHHLSLVSRSLTDLSAVHRQASHEFHPIRDRAREREGRILITGLCQKIRSARKNERAVRGGRAEREVVIRQGQERVVHRVSRGGVRSLAHLSLGCVLVVLVWFCVCVWCVT
jgi:hypothetical protein